MRCEFCGKETMRKIKNQVLCESHYVEAKNARDTHNKIVRDRCGSVEEYMATPMISTYKKTNLLDQLHRTTAGYHLNKMYEELEEKPDNKEQEAMDAHNKKIDARRL